MSRYILFILLLTCFISWIIFWLIPMLRKAGKTHNKVYKKYSKRMK